MPTPFPDLRNTLLSSIAELDERSRLDRTTTRRALALGFPVVLASDGHTSAGNAAISPEQVIAHENATLIHITSFGPRALAIACAEIKILS